jgi:hypothetical protein
VLFKQLHDSNGNGSPAGNMRVTSHVNFHKS